MISHYENRIRVMEEYATQTIDAATRAKEQITHDLMSMKNKIK